MERTTGAVPPRGHARAARVRRIKPVRGHQVNALRAVLRAVLRVQRCVVCSALYAHAALYCMLMQRCVVCSCSAALGEVAGGGAPGAAQERNQRAAGSTGSTGSGQGAAAH